MDPPRQDRKALGENLSVSKGKMESRVNQVVRESRRAVDSIASAADHSARQLEQARSAAAGAGDESDARVSLALGTLALESLEKIRAECARLAAASDRAVSLSEGRPVEPTAPAPAPELPAPRAETQTAASWIGRRFGGDEGTDTGAIRPLLRAISAHRRIVVITTLAALAAAAAFLAWRAPTYEATANILVQPAPQDDPNFLSLGVIRDSGDPIRTTQTAATLLDSSEAAARTAAKLGPGWTTQRVEDSVAVMPIGESYIIAVTGEADTAAESADLADIFATESLAFRSEQLKKQVDAAIDDTSEQLDQVDPSDPAAAELSTRLAQLQSIKQLGDPTLGLQQSATVPDSPSSPGPMIVFPLALIAGLVLGSGGALLREFVDRRIVDAEEAASLYPMSVLTRVPMLPARALERPEGTAWFIPAEVREAFQTLVIQLDQRNRPPEAVMVTSPTRGDGKTTSAINLAVTLAMSGRSVILLDADLRNPQVGNSLGLTAPGTLAELTASGAELGSLLVETDLPTLRVLPFQVDTDSDPSGSEAAHLSQLIRQARGIADCVVVDTPPLGEVSDALTISREVDDILVVVRPGNTNRSQLQLLGDLLDRTGHPPEGCIMIDASERPTGGYHSSGYGIRRMPNLVVGGERPDEQPVEEPLDAEQSDQPETAEARG